MDSQCANVDAETLLAIIGVLLFFGLCVSLWGFVMLEGRLERHFKELMEEIRRR